VLGVLGFLVPSVVGTLIMLNNSAVGRKPAGPASVGVASVGVASVGVASVGVVSAGVVSALATEAAPPPPTAPVIPVLPAACVALEKGCDCTAYAACKGGGADPRRALILDRCRSACEAPPDR